MLKLDFTIEVDGKQIRNYSQLYDNRFEKYYRTLEAKLDELGEIVIEGIRENIMSREYPGGDIDVKRGGIPLYNTGQLYNSITKSKINAEEVDVFIEGNRSPIGLWQYLGTYKGGHKREFWDINQSVENKINEILNQIIL